LASVEPTGSSGNGKEEVLKKGREGRNHKAHGKKRGALRREKLIGMAG